MRATLGRYALSMGAAATLLAGCGGSQQIAQTTSPQLQRIAASTPLPGGAVPHHASLPLARYPRRRHGELFVGGSGYVVDIFPLKGPNQKQIGSIFYGINGPWGLSVDSNKSLYVANVGGGSRYDARGGTATVTVYRYGSTSPSMTYSRMYEALYALADSTGHVFVSGRNKQGQGHVLEFNAGRNVEIAHQRLGSEADGMAEDRHGNLYVAYRAGGQFPTSSIAKFAPGFQEPRLLGMTIDQPQGLLVDRAGNIIVVESAADRIDVFPPGATTPSVTVTISGIGNLAELAMLSRETKLLVSSQGGYVYSMPYPLTPSTVPTEYEQVNGQADGIALTP